MYVTETELMTMVQQFLLPFCRIGAMFMVMPIIGSRIVNARVRLLLALVVTMIAVPLLPAAMPSPGLSLATLLHVFQEIALGVSVGFIFQVVFQVFVLAGQIMAMKMGLGFAAMNDPTNGVQTTIISQFFLMLCTLMFIAINGHLMLIKLIVESFQAFPPANFHVSKDVFFSIANLGSWLFASALLLALPVITAVLFINMAFGVMTRAAPQLNIFSVGFPFTLICGLLLVWIGLGNFTEDFMRVVEDGFLFTNDLLSGQ